MPSADTQAFLEQVNQEPSIQAMVESRRPASSDELFAALAEVAGELGYSVTDAELRAQWSSRSLETSELDDADLERVAAGNEFWSWVDGLMKNLL